MKRIKVSNPDPIIEQAAQDQGTVARFAHVNYVIDYLNDTLGYNAGKFNIVASSVANTPGLVGVGSFAPAIAQQTCGNGTISYTYSDGTFGCIDANFKNIISNITVARTSTGVYTFTFASAPTLGYDVIFGVPTANTTRVSLVETSSTVFTVTATNAGTPADGLLTGMYMEIKFYTN